MGEQEKNLKKKTFTLSTMTYEYEVVVYGSAERADTLLAFLLYTPICTLWVETYDNPPDNQILILCRKEFMKECLKTDKKC